MIKSILRAVALFILLRILWPVLRRLAIAGYHFTIVALIYVLGAFASVSDGLQEKLIGYATSAGILKGGEGLAPAGDLGVLSDYLKRNKVVTVRAIRDLGFSANKSAFIRKNLEKFGIVRTNPQLDNRGEVVANGHGIDQILSKLGEDLLTEDPIMVNA